MAKLAVQSIMLLLIIAAAISFGFAMTYAGAELREGDYVMAAVDASLGTISVIFVYVFYRDFFT